MLTSEIAACCKKLRLSRNIVEMSGKIQADNHQEYLLKLLKSEIIHREKTRNAKLLRKAGFYTIKTFESFRFDEVKNKTNIVMYGNVGTGKTHLSIALGVEACKRGYEVRFFRTSALVNKLAEEKRVGTLSSFLKKLNKAELLICDEWRYVPLDRIGAQLLFEVISERYENKAVIINTNIEFSRWVDIFYDEQMTGARILHHCHLLLFFGQSNRMRESRLNT